MTVSSTYLRRAEAAAYIKAELGFGSKAYLAKLATVGGGPAMVYVSRFPLYSVETLDAWIEAQLRGPVANTCQLPAKDSCGRLSGGAA